MRLRLSAVALTCLLSLAACGDDDPAEDGGSDSLDGGSDASVDSSVKDSAVEVEEDSGSPEADAGDETDAGR